MSNRNKIRYAFGCSGPTDSIANYLNSGHLWHNKADALEHMGGLLVLFPEMEFKRLEIAPGPEVGSMRLSTARLIHPGAQAPGGMSHPVIAWSIYGGEYAEDAVLWEVEL